MTKHELSQLYHINREIELLKRQLSELETTAENTTTSITGLPRGNDMSDKVGKYATEIADLKSLIEVNMRRCYYELNRLNKYINSIKDSEMRQILRLRYINGMSWQQVACSIGHYDESYVRKKHNKFLKLSEKSETHMI